MLGICDQLILNSMVTGALCAVIALGFGLIYHVNRFFHFSHAGLMTLGAYLTLLIAARQFPLIAAIPLALVLCGLVGCCIEIAVYRPLRRRGSSSLILLLSSLGVYVMIQNLVSVCFGDSARTLSHGIVREGMPLLTAKVTAAQLVILVLASLLTCAVSLMLKKTRLGRTMRAVGSNWELAQICGVDCEKTVAWSFAIGSALAGIGGLLLAVNADVTPTSGINSLMPGVVAVIIGGTSNVSGIVLGALLIGLSLNFGAWLFGAQWQDMALFLLLFGILLVRPRGFASRRVRKTSV